jgi:ligand-binding SRPBCC domain-containing protein
MTIQLETFIGAPPERCFDLSLSVDLHLASTARTEERVAVRITGYDRPRMFRDEMVTGPFRRMRHDHRFEAAHGGTRMHDEFEFSTVFPPLDALVLAPHLRRLLVLRNETIRHAAEGDGWRRYLGETSSRSG